MRWATASASGEPSGDSMSTANSSPPKRATDVAVADRVAQPVGDLDQQLVAGQRARGCR